MAFSISDLCKVEVAQSALDEVNAKPIIRSGGYQVQLDKGVAQEYPEWHGARKQGVEGRLRVPVTFFDDDGGKIGVKYFDACPFEFEEWGRKAGDFSRFAQLVAALGIREKKKGAGINPSVVIEALAQKPHVQVWGREFFKVPIGVLDPEEREKLLEAGRKVTDTKKVYLDANDDDLRNEYLQAGLDSDYAIFSIKPPKNLMAEE